MVVAWSGEGQEITEASGEMVMFYALIEVGIKMHAVVKT